MPEAFCSEITSVTAGVVKGAGARPCPVGKVLAVYPTIARLKSNLKLVGLFKVFVGAIPARLLQPV